MKNPRISVLLPIKDGEISKILPALDSIRNQIFKDFECLVLDDSADSNIIIFLKDYCNQDKRFSYIRSNSNNIPEALNFGIQKSNGEFIARADSTDICRKNRFSVQVNFLDKNQNIDVIGSNVTNKSSNSNRVIYFPEYHDDIVKGFKIKNSISHPTVMFRKRIIDKGYNYDEKFSYCEDLELWLRLISAGFRFYNIQQCLVDYEQPSDRPFLNYIYNVKARISISKSPKVFVSVIMTLTYAVLPAKIRFFLNKVYAGMIKNN